LTKNTAIIHGAALHAAEFDQMQKAGTALIWSPKSNIVLYGTTTDVASAIQNKVTVALAPDWSITGSTNTLGEISYAHAYLKNTNQAIITDKRLFDMATSVPARLAGLENEIGTLKANARADLFVLRSTPKQPDDVYSALTQANPQDVVLVLVGGNPVYGLDRLVAPMINTSLAPVSVEPLNVCGEVRAFVTPKDSRRIDTWANLRSRLQVRLAAYDLQLAPLFECP
jgi:cytosine/adenosine deaminase-related metal-dependent hydrolase